MKVYEYICFKQGWQMNWEIVIFYFNITSVAILAVSGSMLTTFSSGKHAALG
jgi:hypothetical protein